MKHIGDDLLNTYSELIIVQLTVSNIVVFSWEIGHVSGSNGGGRLLIFFTSQLEIENVEVFRQK